MSFIYVADGIDDVLAAHLNQYADAWSGVAGKGQPLNMVAINDPINFAISARNLDPTNSRTLQLLKADGTVLFQCDASGVKVSPDGTIASVPVTATATQTLTNKTFTSPILNGTLSGSGGFDPWTTFAPGLTQNVSLAPTVDYAAYTILGKLTLVQMRFTVGGAGTAANPITITGIPAVLAPKRTGIHRACGSGWYLNAGTNERLVGVEASTATTMKLIADTGTDYLGVNPAVTAAVGHVLTVNLSYELA